MQFSKMHGLGNDFMVVDALTQNIFFSPMLVRKLADRHIGIGFDQLLIVEPPYDPDIDFHYRIFNADGSETAQCGNGARCLAYFVHLKGLTKKRDIHISTASGKMILNITNNKLIRVNMGEPSVKIFSLPFRENEIEKKYIVQQTNKQSSLLCSIVSIGNLHCITQVNDIKTTAIEKLELIIRSYERFPKKLNIGFMQVVKREFIRLRVYEYGVGETQACGSGACAAVAAGIIQNLLAEEVCVELPGGKLEIFWKGPGNSLYMVGPATHVYDGFIYL